MWVCLARAASDKAYLFGDMLRRIWALPVPGG